MPLAEDVVTMEEFDDDSLIHIESEKELHTPDIEPSRSEQLVLICKIWKTYLIDDVVKQSGLANTSPFSTPICCWYTIPEIATDWSYILL